MTSVCFLTRWRRREADHALHCNSSYGLVPIGCLAAHVDDEEAN